jgi:hypothetical protein
VKAGLTNDYIGAAFLSAAGRQEDRDAIAGACVSALQPLQDCRITELAGRQSSGGRGGAHADAPEESSCEATGTCALRQDLIDESDILRAQEEELVPPPPP